tara:strand:+ start:156 stop:1208 length:1053 start_codon:yes stop_codon:yes gene_type:complete
MNPQEKLDHIKEVNRIRQQRFYANNRAKIAEKRKEIRDEEFSNREPIEPSTSTLKNNTFIINKLAKNLTENGSAVMSVRKYKNDISTVMNLTDCNELKKCLKYPVDIIESIENGYQINNGIHYSINSKKGFIQSILISITSLKIKLSKKTMNIYQDYFDKLKIMSNNENQNKQQETVISFDSYIDLVKEKFGNLSKEFVLASLYNEATLRDNFNNLIIVKTLKETNDTNNNYIVIGSGVAKLIINNYKTSESYGKIKINLSNELTKIIKSYMKFNNIDIGNSLFGVYKSLSSLVSSINKSVGINGSISMLRHMKVTDLISKESDPVKRIELAKKMGHSPVTQLAYLKTKL